MSRISKSQIDDLYSATVMSEADGKVGKVGTVYLDDDTEQPSWVTVKTGLMGGSASFVPLDEATLSGDELHVPYGKDKIKDAPGLEDDSDLTPAEEQDLYRYYGLAGQEPVVADDERTDPAGLDDTDRRPAPAQDGDSMTLSEERVSVGTQSRESG
ncbi:PRC-barrel domain-containing protein, partial [Pseudokineococcus basanitobsidens]